MWLLDRMLDVLLSELILYGSNGLGMPVHQILLNLHQYFHIHRPNILHCSIAHVLNGVLAPGKLLPRP